MRNETSCFVWLHLSLKHCISKKSPLRTQVCIFHHTDYIISMKYSSDDKTGLSGAATHQPEIIISNSKCRLEGCKASSETRVIELYRIPLE